MDAAEDVPDLQSTQVLFSVQLILHRQVHQQGYLRVQGDQWPHPQVIDEAEAIHHAHTLFKHFERAVGPSCQAI